MFDYEAEQSHYREAEARKAVAGSQDNSTQLTPIERSLGPILEIMHPASTRLGVAVVGAFAKIKTIFTSNN